MTPLRDKLSALAAHGERLRKWGGLLLALAFVALAASVVVIWPDPDSNTALQRTKLLAAPELAALLRGLGVEVFPRTASFMAPADQSLRVNVALTLIALCLIWWLTRKWQLLGRLTLVGFAWPFVLAAVSSATSDRFQLPTFAIEAIADRPNVPLPEELLRRGSRGGQPAQTHAYHLDPARFTGALADQARFVMAQRAYHDGRPAEVARHLRGLSGAWRPQPDVSVTVIGVLESYARAHGEDPGVRAREYGQGRPHFLLRMEIARWSIRLAALLAVLGIALFVMGARRGRSANRLQRALGNASAQSA